MQSHLIRCYTWYMPIFSRAVTTHDHLWRRRDPYLIPIRELGTGSMRCKRDWISSRSAARHFGASVEYTVVLYFGGAL